MAFVYLLIIVGAIWGTVKFVHNAHQRGLIKTSKTAAGWIAVIAAFIMAIVTIVALALIRAAFT